MSSSACMRLDLSSKDASARIARLSASIALHTECQDNYLGDKAATKGTPRKQQSPLKNCNPGLLTLQGSLYRGPCFCNEQKG